MDASLTSYCGLCCADCIPSREELFTLAGKLEQMLEEVKFEHYATLKSASHEEFTQYPIFLSVLQGIRELRCLAPCRLGGGYPRCEIRECARGKEWDGCWQCADRRYCLFLDRLRRVHPHLDYHLDLIAEMGPADWFEKRKAHYRWEAE
jgi:hypothetical protein